MPLPSKGPRNFHCRFPTSHFLNRGSFILFCLLIVLTCSIIALIAIPRPLQEHKINVGDTRSVSVVWDKGESSSFDGEVSGGESNRHRVMGFVGIFTGFRSAGRRQALRQTWLPSEPQGLERLEEATGLAFRFVIGSSTDRWQMSELRKEIAEYDDFMLLDIEEQYS